MSTLPHFALFSSLIAGAAGALILSVVTIAHGLRRHESSDPARRQRLLRIADAAALLCFAVAAGFGTVGLMQQIRAVPPAQAAVDDSVLAERLQALEKRVASAELELQARSGISASEWRAAEDRLATLEAQLHAMEQRVAAVSDREELRRVTPPAVRKTEPPVRAKPAAATPAPASTLPRPTPPAVAPLDGPATSSVSAPTVTPVPRDMPVPRVDPQARVEPPPPLRMEPSVRMEAPARTEPPTRMEAPMRMEPPVRTESSVRTEPPIRPEPPARVESPRAAPEPMSRVDQPRAVVEPPAPADRPAEDRSLGAKLGRDWDEIKRQARRGGDELREGWDQLKRLFGN